jgi:hypothetical protein
MSDVPEEILRRAGNTTEAYLSRPLTNGGTFSYIAEQAADVPPPPGENDYGAGEGEDKLLGKRSPWHWHTSPGAGTSSGSTFTRPATPG